MTQEHPLVSVIITDFNYGEYIAESIESVLNQTYSNIKLIIINDGSTDDSDEVIKTYCEKHPDITYVKQENAGIVATRNRGLELAQGEYLCFLDADDVWNDDYLATLVAQAERDHLDVVYTDLHAFGNDDVIFGMPEFSLKFLIGRNFVHMGSLIRRSAIGKHRFDKHLDKLGREDWDFFLGLALDGVKFAKNSDTYLSYRKHEGSRDVSYSAGGLTAQNKANAFRFLKTYTYIIEKYRRMYPGTVDYTDDSEIVETLTSHQVLQDALDKANGDNAKLHEEIHDLKEDNEVKDGMVNRLLEDAADLNERLAQTSREVIDLRNSKSFRVGRMIAAPLTIARTVKQHGVRATLTKVRNVVRRQKNTAPVFPQNAALEAQKYVGYAADHYPDANAVAAMRKTVFANQPLISVIMPAYNTQGRYLREAIDSVIGQAYANWELVIVDDASPQPQVQAIAKEYVAKDSRIKFMRMVQNGGIAKATNAGIEAAGGEFIALFDHDDLLWPNALHEVVQTINAVPNANFIYTDEDKVNEHSEQHFEPFFKPDWNSELLRSVNYITHFTVIRASVLREAGLEDPEYNGAQDWELFLRVTRSVHPTTICHIAKVLYSWRAYSASTAQSMGAKPYALRAQKKAVEIDLVQRGISNAVVNQNANGWLNVRYPLQGNPLISIVIPSKNQFAVVKRCIESIYARSTYQNFEIILVDTGSDDPQVLDWYKKVSAKHSNFHQLSFVEERFSYSRSCNFGASKAKGELLIQLNNDTEVISSDWMQTLGGLAQRPEIGAVGPLLLYPGNAVIQHAGIGVGVGSKNGAAANLFNHVEKNSNQLNVTQQVMLWLIRDVTAVTGACMVIEKKKFEEVGGFADEFRVTFNDVDLCLKLWSKGYRNVYMPTVELTHHESISVGTPDRSNRDVIELLHADALFKHRWAQFVAADPNYNCNLSREKSDFTL
ncbi:glycosyltransferase [Bifidobacterium catulorum]|nr:glycosyltransferase [Bifidobacterium catulorum]